MADKCFTVESKKTGYLFNGKGVGIPEATGIMMYQLVARAIKNNTEIGQSLEPSIDSEINECVEILNSIFSNNHRWKNPVNLVIDKLTNVIANSKTNNHQAVKNERY